MRFSITLGVQNRYDFLTGVTTSASVSSSALIVFRREERSDGGTDSVAADRLEMFLLFAAGSSFIISGCLVSSSTTGSGWMCVDDFGGRPRGLFTPAFGISAESIGAVSLIILMPLADGWTFADDASKSCLFVRGIFWRRV